MPDPLFLLQIVNAQNGTVVQLPGGGKLERDFVTSCADAIMRRGVQSLIGSPDLQRSFLAACTDAIMAKGVGIGRTEAHVKADVQAGIAETLTAFLMQTDRPVRPLVEAAIADVIATLKRGSRGAV